MNYSPAIALDASAQSDGAESDQHGSIPEVLTKPRETPLHNPVLPAGINLSDAASAGRHKRRVLSRSLISFCGGIHPSRG